MTSTVSFGGLHYLNVEETSALNQEDCLDAVQQDMERAQERFAAVTRRVAVIDVDEGEVSEEGDDHEVSESSAPSEDGRGRSRSAETTTVGSAPDCQATEEGEVQEEGSGMEMSESSALFLFVFERFAAEICCITPKNIWFENNVHR